MPTKLTDKQKTVLAAYISGTNFGYAGPNRTTVQTALNLNMDLTKAVYFFWQDRMSYDEPSANFIDEANWWFTDNLKGYTVEKVSKTWPDIGKVFF